MGKLQKELARKMDRRMHGRTRRRSEDAMRLDDLAGRLEQLEHTRSRLKMYEILGTLIKETRPEEIAVIAYFCEGRLSPA